MMGSRDLELERVFNRITEARVVIDDTFEHKVVGTEAWTNPLGCAGLHPTFAQAFRAREAGAVTEIRDREPVDVARSQFFFQARLNGVNPAWRDLPD